MGSVGTCGHRLIATAFKMVTPTDADPDFRIFVTTLTCFGTCGRAFRREEELGCFVASDGTRLSSAGRFVEAAPMVVVAAAAHAVAT